MVLFKDYYKQVKSLFSDNYNEDRFVFTTRTRPNKNLEISTETSRVKGKDYVSKLGWSGKFDFSGYNFKVDGDVKQEGEFSEKCTVKGLYEGVTLEVGAKFLTDKEENAVKLPPKDEDRKARDTLNFGVLYGNKNSDFSLNLSKKHLNDLLLGGSGSFSYEEFSLGGDFQYEFSEKKEKKEEEKKDDEKKEKKEEKKEGGEEEECSLFKNFNFGVTYKTNNLYLSALVVDKLDKANLGIVHNVNENTTLGVEYSHKLTKKSSPFDVQVGLYRKLDSESNLKAKLLSSGLVSFAYQVKVKPELTATISLETCAKEISEGKVGFELAYEPLD